MWTAIYLFQKYKTFQEFCLNFNLFNYLTEAEFKEFDRSGALI